MKEVEEAASDIAASAKSGLEKTLAVVEEKIETMRTSDPVKIQEAQEKKIARINEAERVKQMTMAQNAPANNKRDQRPASDQHPAGVTEKPVSSNMGTGPQSN